MLNLINNMCFALKAYEKERDEMKVLTSFVLSPIIVVDESCLYVIFVVILPRSLHKQFHLICFWIIYVLLVILDVPVGEADSRHDEAHEDTIVEVEGDRAD